MMEETYVNMEEAKGVSSNHTGVRSSHRRFYRAVILCLGLLSVFLLVGLITLCVHYQRVGDLTSINANLTEHLQISADKLSSMTEERDRLTANLTAKIKELDRLQSLLDHSKTCPSGWTMFGCSCYLVPPKSGSWDEGRADCRGRGADLVVIDCIQEQRFLTTFTTQPSWIGLTDREEEGTWKWIDGTPLNLTDWNQGQPDNGKGDPRYGEEDCVHIRAQGTSHWNDLSCAAQLKWVCEL
ncbi:CD209 antigen-like protein C [Parambassis ranga]|uniref:CD209 antigen-like protein C n=1 Tax=Parambassis ranga TaxID=210632 RepID=A0A6P7H335_9TELE|nr:CD209 antigen-like protein C [Parambassis ranga]XP_028249456.1 CD209 antigen-like protein C [Parambassis ranga]